MTIIVHVNSNTIKSNVKWGERAPPLTVRKGRHEIIARAQEIRLETDPPVLIRYSPDEPLPCGARVWVETEAAASIRKLGNAEFEPADTTGAGAAGDVCP